jgi:probable phosphomutase (TIGR03848 family)
MTVILLRHGVSTSNTARTLAGRAPGVELTGRGTEQAAAVADRLATLPIEHIACSPLLRCQRTVAPLADKLGLEPEHDERLIEVDYGEWTGRPIAELLTEPLWKVVQGHASGAVFPGGEGLAQVQQRAVAAIRDTERRLADKAWPTRSVCIWTVFSGSRWNPPRSASSATARTGRRCGSSTTPVPTCRPCPGAHRRHRCPVGKYPGPRVRIMGM